VAGLETVGTVGGRCKAAPTSLKRGVNESGLIFILGRLKQQRDIFGAILEEIVKSLNREDILVIGHCS
jgi:hypothetical protein